MTKKIAGNQEASEMSLKNLHKVKEYSSKLLKMIQATDELPGWVEDKVSAMSDDMSEVYHYLDSEKKVSAKVWVMKHLSKMASELDSEGRFEAASAVDNALNKIAQIDDDEDFDKLFDDPEFDFEEEEDDDDDLPGKISPFYDDSRYESGGLEGSVVPLEDDPMDSEGDDLHSIMAAFIDGLADGMYDSLEDAMWEAKNISRMYAELMEDEFPEPTPTGRKLPGEREKGQVLEFKPRGD